MRCELIKKCVCTFACRGVVNKGIDISMLLIFRIETFHGLISFWLNCYSTIYLTSEPFRMRNSIHRLQRHFFLFCFILRFNGHHTFHHKFIFCMIFFSFAEKVNDSLDFTVMIGVVLRRFLTRLEEKSKKNHSDKRTEETIKMHTTTGDAFEGCFYSFTYYLVNGNVIRTVCDMAFRSRAQLFFSFSIQVSFQLLKSFLLLLLEYIFNTTLLLH